MITYEIEKKRQQLIETANKYGLTSTKTIRCSQELDKLLGRYQGKRIRPRSVYYKHIC